MADDQVEGRREAPLQFLPRRVEEGCLDTRLGEALAGASQHGLGWLGQGYLMAALGQPQGHVAKPGSDVEHPQWALGQRLAEVGLQHGEADSALGAAIDLFGEAGRQLVEVTVTHQLNRRSLSASLARTTCSMSRPSSLHSRSR